ncbi:MAG: hypothetical protein FH749_10295 [Firmicutes bacterium]|nr:hypothetical protein [Bacillota bacterium]
MLRFIVSLCLVLIILLVPGRAVAHRPIFAVENSCPSEAIAINDPLISWAIYAELTPGAVDYYTFTAEEQLDFYAQMTIPTLKPETGFAPAFALVGPGLGEAPPDFPGAVFQGHGVEVFLPTQIQRTFFEPFTQTRYWIRQEQRITLGPGDYYLLVYNPEAEGGRYTLAVGEEEAWTWRDLLAFPQLWLRVRWWYNPFQTVAILVGLGIIIGLVIRLLLRLRTQRG